MESSSSPCELSLEDLDNNETDLLPPSSQTQTQTLLLPSNTNKRHCTSFNNNTPTLRRCSETLISQPHPQQVERPACPRLIPGPAGTIQAAMHRQLVVSDRGNRSGGASQEYLRRGREDGDDGDFKANAWVCAMGFVGGEGGRFPLSSIKAQILTTQRVPQVVAFVVSCTPNGLGDLVTTLKDPTGTIGANIHRKVLLESEFGKDISVGSVLILHQVAVFAVSRSANYLNITLSNVVKVISKDAGPPSKTLGHPTFTAEIFKNLNKSDMQLEQGCSSSDCGSSSSRYRQHNDAELGEPLVLMRKEATTTTMETTSRGGDNVQKEQSSVVDDFSDNQQTMEGGCPNLISTSRDYQEHTGPVTFAGKSGGVQSLISTTSIPQWTDEQLEELFDDDDTLLFG